MKKILLMTTSLMMLLCALCGCETIGAKSSSMAVIYAVTTSLSLLLLIGYCALIRKKDAWFISLFASVFIVNAGYFSLSVSGTLEEALLANRIAYLGSAVLPLAMLMTIKNVCNINFHKVLVGLLIAVSVAVFAIAATPGYLDIYYKSVELITVNGVSVLNKEYGSWHSVYLYYLLGYFGMIVAVISYAIITKKVRSALQSVVLAMAVFVNIGVWLLEQLIRIDFEILSVSYIVSELFLLAFYMLMQENDKPSIEALATCSAEADAYEHNIECVEVEFSDELVEKCRYFEQQIKKLTPTEKIIYEMHIQHKSSKEIMQELNIKENTLKYHNRNLYSKLGVTSRKELREVADTLSKLNNSKSVS